MKVAIGFLEAIAVLIPDFQTWGLSAPVFLGLHSCVTALGVPQTRGIDPGLVLSLVAGYVVTLGFNLASYLSDQSALCAVTLAGPTSRVAESEAGTSAQQSATITLSGYRP